MKKVAQLILTLPVVFIILYGFYANIKFSECWELYNNLLIIFLICYITNWVILLKSVLCKEKLRDYYIHIINVVSRGIENDTITIYIVLLTLLVNYILNQIPFSIEWKFIINEINYSFIFFLMYLQVISTLTNMLEILFLYKRYAISEEQRAKNREHILN